MSEVFLGVIAAAVLVMATIQVAAIVLAMWAARRIGLAAERLERELRPVVDNLHTMSAEAARAASLAAAQMDRADNLLATLSLRTEQLLAAIPGLLGPAGKGFAFLNGLKAVLSALFDLRRAPRRRGANTEEEDPLFIG